MNNALINWWASFSEIPVAPSLCPASPEGQAQTGKAVIALADWLSAFNTAAFITLALTAAAVLVTYETRVMGQRFWKRWWRSLLLTALVTALACLVWLAWVAAVHTEGCEFGNVTTRIPFSHALNRSTVALAQSALLFVVLSWLLTLVARWSRRPVWYNNSRIPFRF